MGHAGDPGRFPATSGDHGGLVAHSTLFDIVLIGQRAKRTLDMSSS
jgi:hypothetical protein